MKMVGSKATLAKRSIVENIVEYIVEYIVENLPQMPARLAEVDSQESPGSTRRLRDEMTVKDTKSALGV